MTKTVEIQLPDSLNLSSFDLQMIIAARLFEEGKLSSGQAAQVVGLDKRAFLELIGKYGVSVFGYASKEVLEDLSHV